MRDRVYRAAHSLHIEESFSKKRIYYEALDDFITAYAKLSMKEENPLTGTTPLSIPKSHTRGTTFLKMGGTFFTQEEWYRIPKDGKFFRYLLTVVEPVLRYMNDERAHLTYRLGAVQLSHGTMHTSKHHKGFLKTLQTGKQKNGDAQLLNLLLKSKATANNIALLAQGQQPDSSPMLVQRQQPDGNSAAFADIFKHGFPELHNAATSSKHESERLLHIEDIKRKPYNEGDPKLLLCTGGGSSTRIVRFSPRSWREQKNPYTHGLKREQEIEDKTNRFFIQMKKEERNLLCFNLEGEFVLINEEDTEVASSDIPFIGLHDTLENVIFSTLNNYSGGVQEIFEEYLETLSPEEQSKYSEHRNTQCCTVCVRSHEDELHYVHVPVSDGVESDLEFKTPVDRDTRLYTDLKRNEVNRPTDFLTNFIEQRKNKSIPERINYVTCTDLQGKEENLDFLRVAMMTYKVRNYVCLGNIHGDGAIPMEDRASVLDWVNKNAAIKIIGVQEWTKLRYLMEMRQILDFVGAGQDKGAFVERSQDKDAFIAKVQEFVMKMTYPWCANKKSCHNVLEERDKKPPSVLKKKKMNTPLQGPRMKTGLDMEIFWKDKEGGGWGCTVM